MKLVSAIIRPFTLEDVREALCGLDVGGLTVSEVRGFGRQQPGADARRNAGSVADSLPRLKVEAAVADSAVDPLVEALSNAARTGTVGDGRVFVLDLAQVVRVRTDEAGPDAL
jgi:nitrogen regulatory protein P-II 2